MKLAVSCLGWAPQQETQALQILRKYGFSGVEIAPSRIAGPQPYQHPQKAAAYAQQLMAEYGFAVCSLQSLWYGIQGNLFGPAQQRLARYTCEAVAFAKAAGCENLVFGSPKNRVMPEGVQPQAALPFFEMVGNYAAANGVVLALEANHADYGTNFMNTTPQAFAMASMANNKGIAVNLDVGAMLMNDEPLAVLQGQLGQVHHVHISEPQLAAIQPRPLHAQLAAMLKQAGYVHWVSIEMQQQPLPVLESCCAYIAEVFA